MAESGRRTIPSHAVVEQLWQDFSDLGPLKDHVIADDHKGAVAIAREIRRRLREGLLDA
jgi:hypothetical protein